MKADFHVVLDACVMAPHGLCDLFLQLAETPRLYVPRWSAAILDEAQRTQTERLKPAWPEASSDRWRRAVEAAFPDAMVQGFERLIDVVGNEQGDRHVLAAAIKAHAEVIVTFNLRDFRPEALAQWGITASHPADYLKVLYSVDSDVVVGKLARIAARHDQGLEHTLARLGRMVPSFSTHVAAQLGLELPPLA